MAKIIPFLQDDVFDPDALRAMATALDEVCRTLRLNGDQRAREVMAVRIIELARRGERDPERLRDRVLWEAGRNISMAAVGGSINGAGGGRGIVADGRRPGAGRVGQYWNGTAANFDVR